MWCVAVRIVGVPKWCVIVRRMVVLRRVRMRTVGVRHVRVRSVRVRSVRMRQVGMWSMGVWRRRGLLGVMGATGAAMDTCAGMSPHSLSELVTSGLQWVVVLQYECTAFQE